MHRYQPRFHIVYLPPKSLTHNTDPNAQHNLYRRFIFSETSFTAVTAYQNQRVSTVCRLQQTKQLFSNKYTFPLRENTRTANSAVSSNDNDYMLRVFGTTAMYCSTFFFSFSLWKWKLFEMEVNPILTFLHGGPMAKCLFLAVRMTPIVLGNGRENRLNVGCDGSNRIQFFNFVQISWFSSTRLGLGSSRRQMNSIFQNIILSLIYLIILNRLFSSFFFIISGS